MKINPFYSQESLIKSRIIIILLSFLLIPFNNCGGTDPIASTTSSSLNEVTPKMTVGITSTSNPILVDVVNMSTGTIGGASYKYFTVGGTCNKGQAINPVFIEWWVAANAAVSTTSAIESADNLITTKAFNSTATCLNGFFTLNVYLPTAQVPISPATINLNLSVRIYEEVNGAKQSSNTGTSSMNFILK